MSAAVRPGFGPTLPELLGRRARPVGIAAALLAVLAIAVMVLRGEESFETVVVREPVGFNFIHRAPLRAVAAEAGSAKIVAPGVSFTVRPLQLPAFRGDVAGFLPLFASQETAKLEAELDEFLLRQEGRANINRTQGYEILFQYREAGRLHYGRRIWLTPSPTAREGAELTLDSERTKAIPRFDAVGRNGSLKTPLRSFRFGTERP